jgi:hypothetical protein
MPRASVWHPGLTLGGRLGSSREGDILCQIVLPTVGKGLIVGVEFVIAAVAQAVAT